MGNGEFLPIHNRNPELIIIKIIIIIITTIIQKLVRCAKSVVTLNRRDWQSNADQNLSQLIMSMR